MQPRNDCPVASEATHFFVNRARRDLGLSFFKAGCLPLWKNRHESRIALPTARPMPLCIAFISMFAIRGVALKLRVRQDHLPCGTEGARTAANHRRDAPMPDSSQGRHATDSLRQTGAPFSICDFSADGFPVPRSPDGHLRLIPLR